MSVYVAKKATSVDILQRQVERDILLDSALQFGMGRVFSTRTGVAVSGSDTIKLHSGEARIEWRAETARINLNLVDQTYLKTILEHEGLASERASSLAKLITTRRTLNESKPLPKEFQILKGQPLGPYIHIRDLMDVPGVTPALFDKLSRYVTVYGKSAKLDPRLADAELLKALPEISAPQVQELLNLRGKTDEDAQAQLVGQNTWTQYLGFEKTAVTRFQIVLTPKQTQSELWEIVTLHFVDDDRAFRILSMTKHDPDQTPAHDL